MASDSEQAGVTYLRFQHLREITNDFSEEREIGSGTYGVVYKVRSCMHGFELRTSTTNK